MLLALFVGCALRKNELAYLDIETIQQREGRWVLVDLEGKGRRVRTVAIPIWVKQEQIKFARTLVDPDAT